MSNQNYLLYIYYTKKTTFFISSFVSFYLGLLACHHCATPPPLFHVSSLHLILGPLSQHININFLLSSSSFKPPCLQILHPILPPTTHRDSTSTFFHHHPFASFSSLIFWPTDPLGDQSPWLQEDGEHQEKEIMWCYRRGMVTGNMEATPDMIRSAYGGESDEINKGKITDNTYCRCNNHSNYILILTIQSWGSDSIQFLFLINTRTNITSKHIFSSRQISHPTISV